MRKPPRAGAGSASDAMASPPEPKITTYRLLIEYEGTRYSGWQEQRNAPTVMNSLLRAIEEAGFPVVELGGAGRTDAGVHALAQCAHLRLEQRIDPAELCRALNKRLPRDVHVLAATPAEASFHARHDAVARSYLYQISRRRTAMAKPWVWWVRDPLDVGRIRDAARLLTGRHDFRHFAEIDAGPSSSTLVEVERVDVVEEGALLVVRIVASHFLWKMVRRLIGTLAQVGAGTLAPDAIEHLLDPAPLGADDPRPAQWTAPPSGLFLERVLYRGDAPLGPVAAVSRVLAAPSFTGGRQAASRADAPSAPARERGAPRSGRGVRPSPSRAGRPRPSGVAPRRGSDDGGARSRTSRDSTPPRPRRPRAGAGPVPAQRPGSAPGSPRGRSEPPSSKPSGPPSSRPPRGPARDSRPLSGRPPGGPKRGSGPSSSRTPRGPRRPGGPPARRK